MNSLFELILNFGIAVALACCFLASPLYSSRNPSTNITASDFFKLGVEKMQVTFNQLRLRGLYSSKQEIKPLHLSPLFHPLQYF